MSGLEYLPFVLIPLLFWLLLIRPASRKAREQFSMQSEIAVGDEVVLTSGFYATVTAIHDDRLEVELGPNTAATIDRRAVGAVARPLDEDDTETVDTETSGTARDAYETHDAESSLTTDSEEN